MIVVTGANRGLGLNIVEHLRSKNYEVCSLVRNLDGVSGYKLECDVAVYESVKAAAKELRKSRNQVEAVVNVAGVASMNLALTTDHATVARLISTNLIGTINVCQLLAPLMIRQRQGSFINFSTIAVALGLQGESVYAASKAGVETFSRVFARELADFNIRVNCIAPGPIKTDLLRGITDNQIEAIISQQISQRAFKPADISALVEMLLDERSSSLTGQVLNVGGV